MKHTPKLATIERRLAGKCIDLVICICLVFGSGFATDILNVDGAWVLLGIGAAMAYWLLGDAMNGQSVGKRLLGMKVVDGRHGSPCTAFQSLIRNFAGLSWLRIFQIAEEQDAIAAGTFSGPIVIDVRPVDADAPASSPVSDQQPPTEPSAKIDFSGIGDFVRNRKGQNEPPQ